MTDENMNGHGFDICGFVKKNESGGEFLHLLNPETGEPMVDGEGENIGIYLLGRDSDAYRNAQRMITNRRLNNKANANITAERIEAEAIEVLVKCTVSWTGIVGNGEPLECSPLNVKKVYSDTISDTHSTLWIKEQVDDFVAERANFLGK